MTGCSLATVVKLSFIVGISTEQLSLSIHGEWKRMARRRKLLSSHDGRLSPNVHPSHSPSPLFAASSSSSSVTSPGPASPSSSSSAQAVLRSKDQPLFTLRQVTMIVERLWKEREEQVREEYDRVLSDKLAGQDARAWHCLALWHADR